MFKWQFKNIVSKDFIFSKRFSTKEQIFFSKRLAFLLHAGVPLAQSIGIIRAQAHRPHMSAIYAALAHDIEQGKSLASALEARGDSFGAFAPAVVRIGEASGALAQNLGFLADELGKKQTLRRKIASAMAYPSIISGATLLTTTLLVAYIFPKITPVFVSMKVPLPFATRMLMAVAVVLSRYGIFMAIAIFMVGIVFRIGGKKNAATKNFSDRLLLKLPLLAPLLMSYNLANFCRTLALLLASAIPLIEAVHLTKEAQQNARYRAALGVAREGLFRGGALGVQLAKHPGLFPALAVDLITIGEQTGNLPETLRFLSDFYENDLDQRTKALSSAVEPALMLIMGLTVGFVAISIITPIYGITSHLTP